MLGYWVWKIGVMGKWGIGVLTNNCMKCYYSIIPPFHYSWLEYKEWWIGVSLMLEIHNTSRIIKR
jgi:hypothetical protein